MLSNVRVSPRHLGVALAIAAACAAVGIVLLARGSEKAGAASAGPVVSTPVALSEHFAILRSKPTGMPADVAAELGAPGRLGRNAALAHAIATPTGTGWVLPGSDAVCIAVPDPVDGYGVTCTSSSVAAESGAWIGMSSGASNGIRMTVLVPDGSRVTTEAADGADHALGVGEDGVVNVHLDFGDHLALSNAHGSPRTIATPPPPPSAPGAAQSAPMVSSLLP